MLASRMVWQRGVPECRHVIHLELHSYSVTSKLHKLTHIVLCVKITYISGLKSLLDAKVFVLMSLCTAWRTTLWQGIRIL